MSYPLLISLAILLVLSIRDGFLYGVDGSVAALVRDRRRGARGRG